jgi:hypothetical protein
MAMVLGEFRRFEVGDCGTGWCGSRNSFSFWKPCQQSRDCWEVAGVFGEYGFVGPPVAQNRIKAQLLFGIIVGQVGLLKIVVIYMNRSRRSARRAQKDEELRWGRVGYIYTPLN